MQNDSIIERVDAREIENFVFLNEQMQIQVEQLDFIFFILQAQTREGRFKGGLLRSCHRINHENQAGLTMT